MDRDDEDLGDVELSPSEVERVEAAVAQAEADLGGSNRPTDRVSGEQEAP